MLKNESHATSQPHACHQLPAAKCRAGGNACFLFPCSQSACLSHCSCSARAARESARAVCAPPRARAAPRRRRARLVMFHAARFHAYASHARYIRYAMRRRAAAANPCLFNVVLKSCSPAAVLSPGLILFCLPSEEEKMSVC